MFPTFMPSKLHDYLMSLKGNNSDLFTGIETCLKIVFIYAGDDPSYTFFLCFSLNELSG